MFRAAVCILVSFVLVSTNVAKEEQCPSSDGLCQPEPEPECAVFMAPSTIGQGANLGIYTGVDLASGNDINFLEIAIPLLFREIEGHGDNPDGSVWDRYIWNGEVADIESRVDTDIHQPGPVFVPGVGCTVNSIMEMNNIHSTHGSEYHMAGLHRKSDPGAGAFTPYHGSKTTTSEDIPAGGELFAEYGEEWIPLIPGAIITLDDNLDGTQCSSRRHCTGG